MNDQLLLYNHGHRAADDDDALLVPVTQQVLIHGVAAAALYATEQATVSALHLDTKRGVSKHNLYVTFTLLIYRVQVKEVAQYNSSD